MDDKELFAAWNRGSEQEKQVLKQHQGEYLRLVRSQSNDVFAKIKKNIFWEVIISVIISVIFPFLFWNDPIFFWIIVGLMLVAAVVGGSVYRRYLLDMKQLNESSLVESLEKKLKILSHYVKRLYIYLYVFAPLGFVVGLAFALQEEEMDLTKNVDNTWNSLAFLNPIYLVG